LKHPFIPNRPQNPNPRSASEITFTEVRIAQQKDVAKLEKNVDKFAKLMKAKLKRKSKEGVFGWDTVQYTKKEVETQIAGHYLKLINGEAQAVDIANLCMFWAFKNNDLL
jgi:hypothetical protein